MLLGVTVGVRANLKWSVMKRKLLIVNKRASSELRAGLRQGCTGWRETGWGKFALEVNTRWSLQSMWPAMWKWKKMAYFKISSTVWRWIKHSVLLKCSYKTCNGWKLDCWKAGWQYRQVLWDCEKPGVWAPRNPIVGVISHTDKRTIWIQDPESSGHAFFVKFPLYFLESHKLC